MNKDIVYYSFESDIENQLETGWGYHFFVYPIMKLRIKSESIVLSHGCIEWTCFLMNYCITNQSINLGKNLYNMEVYKSLLLYLMSKGTPYKGRIIELIKYIIIYLFIFISLLLKDPQLFIEDAEKPPDFLYLFIYLYIYRSELKTVPKILFEYCEKIDDDAAKEQPLLLLQMIELVASITEATNVLQNKTERLTNDNIQSYITTTSKYLDQSDLHRCVLSISISIIVI